MRWSVPTASSIVMVCSGICWLLKSAANVFKAAVNSEWVLLSRMSISEFRGILNHKLRDELVDLGFRRTDSSTFVRKTGAREINVIWIQKHSSESKLSVNLGVHYDFLPKVGTSESVEGSDIAQPDCEIQRRLTPDPLLNDYWWPLGDAEADEIVDLVKNSALPYFSQYALEGDIGLITPEQIDDHLPALLSSLTKVRACLLMARILEQQKEPTRASEFARLGIKSAGMAAGPKQALKEILERTE